MPELRSYQIDAIDFALRKRATFMAIDRGLGKTAIAIKAIKKVGLPALVLCPPKVAIATWPAELRKWSDLTYVVLHGKSKAVRMKLSRDVYILPYTSLKWFYTMCVERRFTLRKFFLVLDESSWVKNHSTDRFKKYLQRMEPIYSKYRMALSATPSPNGLHQLWPQYYLLDGGKRLGQSYTPFRDRHFVYHGPPRYQTEILPMADVVIHDKVKDITFRLENKHFEFMPNEVYSAIELDMPPNLAAMYKKLEKDFFMDFGNGDVVAPTAEGTASNKLRQVMQGAVYIDREDPYDKSPKRYRVVHTLKTAALKEIVEGQAGQPLLCAINFRFERDMINKSFGYEVPCIAGGVSTTRQVRYMNQWNNRRLPLLLVHPASVGHGLNLQFGGNNILWYSMTWDLELYIQLNGRLARSGQEAKSVVINHLIFKNTVDTRLMSIIGKKDLTQQEFLRAMMG